MGTTPSTQSIKWRHAYYGSTFQAGAVQDTRGWLWAYPYNKPASGNTKPTCTYGATDYANCLIRMDLDTGTPLSDPIDLTVMLNGSTQTDTSKAYMPSSALTMTRSGSSYYLTMGATKALSFGSKAQVITLDVTTPSGSLLWTTQDAVLPGNSSLPTVSYGQFPVVHYSGHVKTVFTGDEFGPYLYGN